MREITYTLLGDGTSDKALLPIINWTIRKWHPDVLIQAQWADFSRLPVPPKSLPDRMKQALELYPCDWLFVHRDAEKQPVNDRQSEIEEAWKSIGSSYTAHTVVGITPVRMTEAWLLLEEKAIRLAASNPSGKQPLVLPSLKMLESVTDPKHTLQQLLREASGLNQRRLQKFNVSKATQLVAEMIDDFAKLEELTAFNAFEQHFVRATTIN
ncbi:MAG: hypothetical protein LH609_11635 [Rudanella sp.]|nr:hypothetical protein [Rudanella sp.]